MKGTLPTADWINIGYKKYTGPYDSFEEGRKMELRLGNVSTNDEEAFSQLEATINTELPKRPIQKPSRYNSELSEGDVKQYKGKKSIGKTRNISSDEEDSNKTNYCQKNVIEINKKIIEPPINYIRKGRNNTQKYKLTKIPQTVEKVSNKTYSPAYGVAGCSDEQPQNSFLDCGYYFPEDELQEQHPEDEEIERNNEIFTIQEDDNFNEELPEEENEDLLHERAVAMQTLIKKQKPIVVGNVRTNITLPPKVTKKKRNIETETAKHEQSCCRLCHTEIKAIHEVLEAIHELHVQSQQQMHNLNRKIEMINHLLLDRTPNTTEETKNNYSSSLRLPITSQEELQQFEETLIEDSSARSQYRTLIKKVGGADFYKHTKNALSATFNVHMAYEVTWSGHNESVAVGNMKFMDLIIDTVTNNYVEATSDNVKKVAKHWLQHAGDRLPKGTTKKTKKIK